MKPIFVIEHMEEDFFEWSFLEYRHLQDKLGDAFWLTSLPSSHSYSANFGCDDQKYYQKSILDLDIPRNRICLLDSESTDLLSPADINNFDYFLAGGILGDVDENDPDRTQELRVHGFPTRNLGKDQMTMDTAILTAHKIISEGVPFENIQFNDRPTFQLDKNEYVDMPFKYLADKDGLPIIPPGMLDLWRQDVEFN